MLATFMDTFREKLFGFQQTYLASESIRNLISENHPLSDAVTYLNYATTEIFSVQTNPTLVVSQVVARIKTLEIARDILGEVLDDLEAEENVTLRPVWDREAKQLWYGDVLCREYRRVASEQFQILDMFQQREWPQTIPSPFRTEKQLRDTVRNLDVGRLPESPIRFEVFNMRPRWFPFRPRSGPNQLR
jgi:hypothetical protein